MANRVNKALTYFIRAFLLTAVALTAACSNDVVDLNDPVAVYENYCFACHDSGAAGAPLLGNKAYWQQAQSNKSRLYQNTVQGIRAMPAKGTCLSCNEEQLNTVVDWMLKQ